MRAEHASSRRPKRRGSRSSSEVYFPSQGFRSLARGGVETRGMGVSLRDHRSGSSSLAVLLCFREHHDLGIRTVVGPSLLRPIEHKLLGPGVLAGEVDVAGAESKRQELEKGLPHCQDAALHLRVTAGTVHGETL